MTNLSEIQRVVCRLAGLELGNHLFASSVNRLRATLAWKSGSVWHRRHCLVWASDDRDNGDNWCQLSTVRLDRRGTEGYRIRFR